MNLTYDDNRHEYRLDGVLVPSVTQALKLAGLIDLRWFTADDAALGTAVHAVCEQIDVVRQHGATVNVFDCIEAARVQLADQRYALPRLMLDDSRAQARADAYARLVRDEQIEYAGIEVMTAHQQLRYGCRMDRVVARLRGAGGVLEIKPPTAADWHGVQLALYQLAQPCGPRWRARLGDNGRAQLDRMTNADDYRIGIDAIRQAHAALRLRPRSEPVAPPDVPTVDFDLPY